MLVFFDEAGDAGMAGKVGQSPIFLVVVVLFEDHDVAEKADIRIGLIRHELGLIPDHEFKFHSSRPDIRRYFLKQMLPYSWFYLVVAINKKKLYSETFRSPEMFYNYSTRLRERQAALSSGIVRCSTNAASSTSVRDIKAPSRKFLPLQAAPGLVDGWLRPPDTAGSLPAPALYVGRESSARFV